MLYNNDNKQLLSRSLSDHKTVPLAVVETKLKLWRAVGKTLSLMGCIEFFKIFHIYLMSSFSYSSSSCFSSSGT